LGVKNRRSIVVQTLTLCCAATLARAGGVTYPDGTASAFAPGFFGVGICTDGANSEVNGVAAKDGVFIAAVGDCGNADPHSAQVVPVLFKPDGSILVLPYTSPQSGGSARGISGDGKIKVGYGGATNGCYWDQDNQLHTLPTSNGYSTGQAVSRDGSVLGGADGTPPDPNVLQQLEATIWAPGGTGNTKLGIPTGYDDSIVEGLSQDGQTSCGTVYRLADTNKGITAKQNAFLQSPGGGFTIFGRPGDVDETQFTSALGAASVSLSGNRAVGVSGNHAVLWDDLLFKNGLVLEVPFPAGAGVATAIDDNANHIVGWVGNNDTGEYSALLWENQSLRGTIAGTLQNTYKVPTGLWKLRTAACISGDGFTVGGQGTNPDGKFEGWIAILPPILFPPNLVNPGPRHANPAELFSLQIQRKNALKGLVRSFSAKGLPKGFSIDSASGIISGIWSADEAAPGNYTVTVTGENEDGTGSITFTLTLPPPSPPDKTLQGHSYLQQNKAPGDESFYASAGHGVSANGQTAVGTDGFGSDARAYQWTSTDGISGLPMLDGALRTYGSALAVSADGKTIAGQAESAPGDDGKDHSVATVWQTSTAAAANRGHTATHYAERETASTLTATNIGLFPGGIVSIANAVSADGSVVVGYGDEKINSVPYQVYQAFKWTAPTGMVGLGWLPGGRLLSEAYGISPDGSTIVGTSDSAIGSQAMRYTAGEGMVGLGLPPGASYGGAVAASTNGSVIAGYNNFAGNDHAFRWTTSGGMTDLGVLPGDSFSEATAVSADGSIVVGQSAPDFNQQRAFIWDEANGMRDLKSVIVADNPDLANWTLRSANAISADGKTIVGVGKNPDGNIEGFTAVLEVQPAQSLNISTRMQVLTGDNVLIAGFIVTGNDPKKVIIRGIGPSLAAAGLQNAMVDPTLELHQGSSTVASNDNWKEHEADVQATGIPPVNDFESAIVTTLAPGAYTAILADKENRPGAGVVEVYDLTEGNNAKLANISTRGFVDSGDNVMIGGFIVGGGSVGGVSRVLVRAIGPSLTAAGVPGALKDPTLTLYDNNGLVVSANDNWKTNDPTGQSQETVIRATGVPPANDLESAIVETLVPGAYTAIVRGKNNATGVGLVEVYTLP
jgi:probable HAF family extracellular repeat protein